MSSDEFDDSSYYDKTYFITRVFDERKPRVPYTKGLRFTVQQHIPPPPVEVDPFIRCNFADRKASEEMEQLHPLDRCLEYPPLPGSYGASTLELEIIDTIRIGDHHHAQVVVVEVLAVDFPIKGIRLSQGQRVVAKLYDPMYINDNDFYVNPFLVADKEYTHETATYEALSEYQGAAIAEYYGSYSLDVPVEVSNDYWIDWWWQPWLQTEFAGTAAATTPGMLEYYMPYYLREEVGDDLEEGLRRVVGY